MNELRKYKNRLIGCTVEQLSGSSVIYGNIDNVILRGRDKYLIYYTLETDEGFVGEEILLTKEKIEELINEKEIETTKNSDPKDIIFRINCDFKIK